MRTVTYTFPQQSKRKLAELEEVFGSQLIEALKLSPLTTEAEAENHGRSCARRQLKPGETIREITAAALANGNWSVTVELNECPRYQEANPLTWTPPPFPSY